MTTTYRHIYSCRSLVIAIMALITFLGIFKAHATDRQFGAPQYLGVDFTFPSAVAFDAARERVIVLSSGLHQIAYASLASAREGADWTIIGAISDRSAAAALNEPEGLAVDSSGNIFVADTFNNRAVMYRYDESSDTYTLDSDFASNTSTSVEGLPISRPRDIAVAPDDSIYLLDSGNRRILRANNADAQRYTVIHHNEAWAYPHGLDVDSSNTIYIADTPNHRIVRITSDGVETEFGQYGRGPGHLRYPKDVAISPSGLIVVADTHNHRLAIFGNDLRYFRALGQPPLIRNPESVAIDSEGRIFVADIERKDVIAYLGPEVDPQFDGFIRDSLYDEGVPPTPLDGGHDSPDILVSLSPSFDLNELVSIEFETLSSEAVTPDSTYYLYFAIRNLGDRSMPTGSVRVYSSSEDIDEPLYQFPEEWHTNETFLKARGSAARRQEHRLTVDSVPAGGKTVVGPLEWQPSGTTDRCDSNKFLMARLVNLYDPTIRESDNGLEQALASNNISVRTVPFVSADCIPSPDGFESNDSPEDAVSVSDDWDHLHAVCPRHVERAGYPQENSCENIFEDLAITRFSEEIWTLSIGDLSLHSGLDRDFFSLPLPDFADPRYQVSDITQEFIREEYSDSPSYVPSPMPECGVVKRLGLGPAGADREVTINVVTELVIEVVPEGPPNNNVSPRPVDRAGEELLVYTEPSDDLTRNSTIISEGNLVKRIVCPRDIHGLDDVLFSFGERMDPVTARELTSTGGYRIDATYLSSIDRGIPNWADDPGVTGQLDCFGIGPIPFGPGGAPTLSGFSGLTAGSRFPFCGFDFGDLGGFIERHPRFPIPNCIADGPGCFSRFYFYWPGLEHPIDVALLSNSPLAISLIDASGQAIFETQLSDNVPREQLSLFDTANLDSWKPSASNQPNPPIYGGQIYATNLQAGFYGITIEGPPGEVAFAFKSLAEQFEQINPPKQRSTYKK